ncbi:hypothetical protein M422DRAFT_263360 [Sphaerobolus stellatus SS14]|uniref:Unplaced genomic scaffold SPHSTscaffold_123, whole genome shotgun sequence n=1 Tax=Sphaerobolus stellatus (strain SS14) TaxID=990650 RepID=A0A0C9VAR1_SPHS4|nr:hypothetical protein M422DRAFT_263360 [Sphaerobolus stellatus SS14]
MAWTILDNGGIAVLDRNLNPDICSYLRDIESVSCIIPFHAIEEMVRSLAILSQELPMADFLLLQGLHIDYGQCVVEEGDIFPDADISPMLKALEDDFPGVDLSITIGDL